MIFIRNVWSVAASLPDTLTFADVLEMLNTLMLYSAPVATASLVFMETFWILALLPVLGVPSVLQANMNR